MILNSRILLLKLGLRINAATYFKDQSRPLSRLATVMFRGTLCTLHYTVIIKLESKEELKCKKPTGYQYIHSSGTFVNLGSLYIHDYFMFPDIHIFPMF